jgi:hypothetical protein
VNNYFKECDNKPKQAVTSQLLTRNASFQTNSCPPCKLLAEVQLERARRSISGRGHEVVVWRIVESFGGRRRLNKGGHMSNITAARSSSSSQHQQQMQQIYVTGI